MPRPARSSRRPQIEPPSPEFGVRLPRLLRKRGAPGAQVTHPSSLENARPASGHAASPPPAPPPPEPTGTVDPNIVLYGVTRDARVPSPDGQPAPAGAALGFGLPGVEVIPTGPDGWRSSRGFRSATHLLIFSATLAAGMIWFKWRQPAPATAPATTAGPMVRQPDAVRRLPAEAFDFIYRLRESAMVGGQLDRHFHEAQNLYRENQFDEFLDLDPWGLPLDQLCYLNHFCDKGFFSAEREILIALLENRINRGVFGEPGYRGSSAVAARLGAAVESHEQRIDDLRLAIEIYHRGREGEIVVPSSLSPDQDQALRASVVQKLAVERRKRDALDQTLAALQARLNGAAR
jgi:hypothetical protein